MVAERFSADQAERHDEMAEYMLRVGEQPAELLIEERSLSIADKNAVGSRRASWRVDTSVEQKENTEGIEEQAAKLDGGCAAQAPEWNDFGELIPKWLNSSRRSSTRRVFLWPAAFSSWMTATSLLQSG